MNEMMTALEAMLRRIVREELDSRDSEPVSFDSKLTSWFDQNPLRFAARVKEGTLDQGWFDDAIKAEIAVAAVAAPAAAGYTFPDKPTFDLIVAASVRDSTHIANWVHDKVIDTVGDLNFTVRVS